MSALAGPRGGATLRTRAGGADPVLLAGLLVIGAVMLVLAGNRWSSLAQGRLYWLMALCLQLGTFYFARRTAMLLPAGHPARRFWRTLSFAGLTLAAGFLSQLMVTMQGPYPARMLLGGPVQLVLSGCVVLAVLSVICLYPLGISSVRERWCFLLDLATVMVATSATGWFFADWSVGFLSSATIPVLITVTVAAATKLLLSGEPPFSLRAGTLGVVAAATGAVSATLGPGLIANGHSGWFFAASLLSLALLTTCARVQARQAVADPNLLRRGRRRAYSAVPYVAVGVPFLLLASALAGSGSDRRTWLVLVGAALSTGLVIIRQIISFEDNSRLLGELRRTDTVLRSALDERDLLAVQLRELAYQDALTGLANRAMFNDRLAGALVRARRHHTDLLVMLLDLDSFKRINDQHGHAAGDLVLREAGRRMRHCLRSSDTVARLGGDEFGIVIEAPLPVDVGALRRRLEAAVRDPVEFGSALLRVGISIGVAVCPGGDGEIESLLHQADAAMYASKRQGRAIVEPYRPGVPLP